MSCKAAGAELALLVELAALPQAVMADATARDASTMTIFFFMFFSPF